MVGSISRWPDDRLVQTRTAPTLARSHYRVGQLSPLPRKRRVPASRTERKRLGTGTTTTRRGLLACTRPEGRPEDATIRSYGYLPRVGMIAKISRPQRSTAEE